MQKEPPLSPEEQFIGTAQCKLGAIWERSQKADVTAQKIADDVEALLAWMRRVVPRCESLIFAPGNRSGEVAGDFSDDSDNRSKLPRPMLVDPAVDDRGKPR